MAGNSSGADYTLNALIEKAVENSHDLQAIREEITKANAQVWEAAGGAFPEINASVNLQHAPKQFNPMAMGPSNEDMPSATRLLEMDTTQTATPADFTLARLQDGMVAGLGSLSEVKKNTLALSLDLQQPLFAQGKIATGLQIARHYRRGLDSKYQGALIQTRTEVAQLFYGGLIAQKNLEIQTNALELAEESHRLSVVRFASGKGAEIDTLTSKVHMEQTRLSLREAETHLRMAYAALIKKAGIDETVGAIRLAGDLPRATPEIGLQQAIELATRNNYQLKELESIATIQRKSVRMARTDYLPMVYGGVSVGKIAQFNDFGKLDNDALQSDQKVFVGASWTIFSGLKRHQRIVQARADVRAFAETKAAAEDGVKLGVRNAWETMESARLKLVQTRDLVRLARKGYQISKRAYDVGARTLLEFQKAEQDLSGALLAENAARLSFHSARLDLEALIGIRLL